MVLSVSSIGCCAGDAQEVQLICTHGYNVLLNLDLLLSSSMSGESVTRAGAAGAERATPVLCNLHPSNSKGSLSCHPSG